MTKKADLQKTKKKRDPLGKSLPDILSQSIYSPKTTPVLFNQATGSEKVNEDSHSSIYLINLDEIGKILKDKRKEKGKTIEYISDNLCLNRFLIESIELGNWKNLPHKVYVKGYIKKYASLLGAYDEILPYLIEKQPEKYTGKTENKKDKKQNNRLDLLPVSGKIPKTVFIYSAVIALVLCFFIFDYLQKDSIETAKLENAVKVADSKSDGDDKESIPIDTKKLMITCNERTWVSVIIDSTEKKEFILKPQEVVMLNAKEKFDLLIGNAGGVKLMFNGKDIGFTGESGQVKRITLS